MRDITLVIIIALFTIYTKKAFRLYFRISTDSQIKEEIKKQSKFQLIYNFTGMLLLHILLLALTIIL